MSNKWPVRRLRLGAHPWRWVVLGAIVAAGAAAVYGGLAAPDSQVMVAEPVPDEPKEATAAQVRQFCGTACHAYPPADTFPRWAWRREVKQAYDFFRESGLPDDFPSQESVALYYERRAPEELAELKFDKPDHPLPLKFERKDYYYPRTTALPAVSNVNLVHLFDKSRLDILVCEMGLGQILVLQPYLTEPAWHVVYSHGPDKGFNPAHAEVIDLDGDGIPDILVANLGSFLPTDARCGSVIWLRGLGGGRYEPFTLLEGVGRVADVQAADFRGCGRLDLVVAAFGWLNTGGIVYLENQTTDWKSPRFVPRVLDNRHGAIHVPVGDLNGDGKPDFVALISQEHETIVAFLNEGGGQFSKHTVSTAEHPAFGSSGIQLVDLNGDGKLDVLYSNGDVLDSPYLLKPYHGVQWLENRGEFPFQRHQLTSMYGAMRAVAADFTGQGKQDVLAVSWLPEKEFPQRNKLHLDSIIFLEQVAANKYVRHSLETGSCDYLTCVTGDIFGRGRPDLVTGVFSRSEGNKAPPAITILENRGVRGSASRP